MVLMEHIHCQELKEMQCWHWVNQVVALKSVNQRTRNLFQVELAIPFMLLYRFLSLDQYYHLQQLTSLIVRSTMIRVDF